jgi:hypothetical protein
MAAWTTTELNVLLTEYKQKLTRFVAGQRRRRRQWNFLSLGTCVSLVSAWEDSDTVVYWMTNTEVFVLLYLCGHHIQNVIA